MLVNDLYKAEMVRNRRHIHKRPEEGWTEFETTAYIVNALRQYSCEVLVGKAVINPDFVMGRDPKLVEEAIERARNRGIDAALLEEMGGFTGCVAIFRTGRPGPVTALRFDIDCVCVQETDDPAHEANAGGYASERPGLMHACGHDGHTAVGLGIAHWVNDHLDELKGTIKLIFQPAEEGTRGASPLAESGIVDDVDNFVSSHIGTNCRLGEIGICFRGFLATTKIDIHFEGTPAHAGSNPEKGRSALLAACSSATMLAGIPRSSEGDTRISIGRLVAGSGRNVVPAHAVMQIETRGSTEAVNNYMVEYAKRIVEGNAHSYDVKVTFEKVGEATTLVADEKLTEDLTDIAKRIPFIHSVDRYDDVKGSEDCTMIGRKVRSHGGRMGFFMFGCNQNGHHRGDFSIQDEESLPEGFEMFAQFLMKENGREA